MATAPAQIPTSFGHELRACLRCRLVKTYDQFRESGCENCSFFKMEEDHERVVDCTTPNFNGFVDINSFSSKSPSPLNLSILILFFFFHLILPQDHFSYGSKSELGCPLVGKFVPCVYTLAVSEALPEEIQAICEDERVQYIPPKLL